MKIKQYVVIGYGNLGKELVTQLDDREDFKLHRIIKRDGVYDSDYRRVSDVLVPDPKQIDIVFICLPSIGDGEQSLRFILSFVEAGIPVVLAEKAALANFPANLRPHEDLIAYDVTVGAAGFNLPLIKEHRHDARRIQMILNGTLQLIWHGLSRGMRINEVLVLAEEKKYLESHQKSSLLDIVNTEFEDVYRKGIISYNTLQEKTLVSAGNFKPLLGETELTYLITYAKDYRPYLEINTEETDCSVSHMRMYRLGEDFMYIGFVRVDDTDFGWGDRPKGEYLRSLEGTYNAFSLFTDSGSRASIGGAAIGAGLATTASTMIRNANRLLGGPDVIPSI